MPHPLTERRRSRELEVSARLQMKRAAGATRFARRSIAADRSTQARHTRCPPGASREGHCRTQIHHQPAADTRAPQMIHDARPGRPGQFIVPLVVDAREISPVVIHTLALSAVRMVDRLTHTPRNAQRGSLVGRRLRGFDRCAIFSTCAPSPSPPSASSLPPPDWWRSLRLTNSAPARSTRNSSRSTPPTRRRET